MSKLLSKTQVKHINKSHSKKLEVPEVVLVLQDVADAINVGSIFRTADASSVSKLVLTGSTPAPPNPQINTTARGLERSVAWEYTPSCSSALSALKSQGYQVVALEVTPDSQLYTSFEYQFPLAIVLGNEALGVYKKHLQLCDAAIHIPMLGKGQSLNVNIAAAVATYTALAKYN